MHEYQELLLKLANLRKIIDEATLGPWRAEDSKYFWSLHGEARDFKKKNPDASGPSMQILKAAKTGTPYAEYWPNAADGKMLVESANRFAFFLDWADDVAARHYPLKCGCVNDHYLCGEHRVYNWNECPEIIGLIRAVEMFHEVA